MAVTNSKSEITSLSTEQRLRFREKQVKLLTLMNQVATLRQQVEVEERELQQLLTVIANECNVDPVKYTFDGDTAQFVPKQ